MPETQNTAIAMMNEYPDQKFNLLVPVKTMQELSPLHKVVINQVQINPDPEKKDVYKEKNGEFALTKKGLAKLMTAANIQIVESKSVTPQRCQRCADIAAKTKVAPRCFECPNVDDVAYQITLAVPEPSGTWRKVIATKEIRMADVQKTMSDKQFQSFFPFRTEQCETKALNRALREALMLNATYKPADLQKPFAVAYIVPNMNDPEIKKAVAARYAESTVMLFGNGRSQVIEAQTEEVTVIGPDEPEEEKLICERCNEEIKGTTKGTAEELAQWTKENYGQKLCYICATKAAKEAKDKNQ